MGRAMRSWGDSAPAEPRCSRAVLRQRPAGGCFPLESFDRSCGFGEEAYAALRGTKATTTSASKTAAMRRSNGRECRL
jgi:hypothetical protein